VTALRLPDRSASQTIALRFPRDWGNVQATAIAPAAMMNVLAEAKAGLASSADDSITEDAQTALLSPEPMLSQISDSQNLAPRAAVQAAGDEKVGSASARNAAPPAATPTKAEIKPVQIAEAKSIAVATRRRLDRPGFVLDDAQIASVKRRLNLTPDQERMWPAVEAALRNLAYVKAHQAPGRNADKAQLAATDPNSEEVQDLKSAAIPLIMSFNDEQKDEVRNLAHVMGLDQLASQF
jgi:hypothetical protein